MFTLFSDIFNYPHTLQHGASKLLNLLSLLWSVSGMPFCYFRPLPLTNSKLKFTALEFGLTGSEEIEKRVVKSKMCGPEP